MSFERDLDEDRLIRARRAALSEDEQRRFRDELLASPEARLLYEAGQSFDREAPVVAGDDARIERMVRHVQRRRPRVKRSRWAWKAVPALVAGLLIGGVAVAAVGFSTSLFQPKAGSIERSGVTATEQRAPTKNTEIASPSGETTEIAPSELPNESGKPLPGVRHQGGSAESAAPNGQASDQEQPAVARFDEPASSGAPAMDSGAPAAELFSTANSLRVHGDLRGAIDKYERLKAEFPKSTEAATARLSLGMLYLKQGRAERSLEEFRAYRSGGRGETMAEALWGEASALRELARKDEERRVLEELLRRYPQSAYAASAQKRLLGRD